MLASSNGRLAAARRLTRRRTRRETGRFLAEGPQAVREALAADVALDVFATAEAIERNPWLHAETQIDQISAKDAAALSETVTPQGLVAVCAAVDVPLADALGRRPRLAAALVALNDPGNAGTVLRTADAAGADAVIFCGGVDPYNGKVVRASAGSLFHLDVVAGADPATLLTMAREAGCSALAATGAGECDLDELADTGALARPTLWLFGNEAHGLAAQISDAADARVHVPIHGRAESLNVAAAAAVCLYASARAHRA